MSTSRATWSCAGLLLSLGLGGAARAAEEADLILQHGKVVSFDRDLSVRQALAVEGDRLLRVGTDQEVLETRGPRAVIREARALTTYLDGTKIVQRHH
jgi:hypothetical protein